MLCFVLGRLPEDCTAQTELNFLKHQSLRQKTAGGNSDSLFPINIFDVMLFGFFGFSFKGRIYLVLLDL